MRGQEWDEEPEGPESLEAFLDGSWLGGLMFVSIFLFLGKGAPGHTSSLRNIRWSLAGLVWPPSEFYHIPKEGTQWTVVKFDADAGCALAPLKAIVAFDIHRGDGFRERIELLFAIFCHSFSTHDVPLLRLLRKIAPICANLQKRLFLPPERIA